MFTSDASGVRSHVRPCSRPRTLGGRSTVGAPPRRATRQPDQQRACSRARAATPSRARLPAPHRGLAHNGTEGWCGRDTGARISKTQRGQSRAAGHKPLTPALRYVSHPHHHRIIPRDPADARPCASTRPPARQKASTQYIPSTDDMHTPPGCAIAVPPSTSRSGPARAPNEHPQRWRTPDTTRRKALAALDFSSADTRVCACCASAVRLLGRFRPLRVINGDERDRTHKRRSRVDTRRGATAVSAGGGRVAVREAELGLRIRARPPDTVPARRPAHPLHPRDARTVARRASRRLMPRTTSDTDTGVAGDE
jgi:hypothetical protein